MGSLMGRLYRDSGESTTCNNGPSLRCMDVLEEMTVAELTLQLEREKILPPGGTLVAGSKKLKKDQLMNQVPNNIEVMLGLCGGAPDKEEKSSKLNVNVQEQKGSKIRAEKLREKIKEEVDLGHELSNRHLGRILKGMYNGNVRFNRSGRSSCREKRDYYYYGIELKVQVVQPERVERDNEMQNTQESNIELNKSNKGNVTLPSNSEIGSKAADQAIQRELDEVEEERKVLRVKLQQQNKTVEELRSRVGELESKGQDLKDGNEDLLCQVVALNEEKSILYEALSNRTASSFVTKLADIPPQYKYDHDTLVKAFSSAESIGRGAYGKCPSPKIKCDDVRPTASAWIRALNSGNSMSSYSKPAAKPNYWPEDIDWKSPSNVHEGYSEGTLYWTMAMRILLCIMLGRIPIWSSTHRDQPIVRASRASTGPQEHQHPHRPVEHATTVHLQLPFRQDSGSDFSLLAGRSFKLGTHTATIHIDPPTVPMMLLRRLPLHPTLQHHRHRSGPHSDPADSHHQ
uniref:Uncharacterized protein n=1 Tax=Branchiostoma floridae TaxID=7739 RepID=C3YG64_BRAFL|eukprot:XP_002604859.1 hypothetical protein BRAFLDRAFT_70711 [Branchiostoma floridae]